MVPVARHHALVLIGALAAALACDARGAAAQPVSRCAQTITLERDGSARVTIEMRIGSGGNRVLVPLDAAKPRLLALSGVRDASADIVPGDGRAFVDVRWSEAAAGATLRLELAVDRWPGMTDAPLAFGNRRLTTRFANTMPVRLPAVRTEIVLPEGFVVSSIDSVEPPVTDATVTLPYDISRRAGRQVIATTERPLGIGERVGMTLRVRQERSVLPLVSVLALLAGAYLVWFRDLVRRRPAPAVS